ncbi:MAG: DUF2225 domain-containing protein [Acidaminobacteraceae bacterium]
MTSELIDKKLECPICNTHFTSKKVKRSKISVIKRHPDYYTEYGGENPTYYGVFVCPVCGYSAFEGNFNDITENEKQIMIQAIGLQWKGRSYSNKRSIKDAIEAHKLALLAYDLRNYKSSIIGKIALRLSWFYREGGNIESESFYKKIVLERFQKAFLEERLDEKEDEEIVIMYIIGELLRCKGEFENAIKWYDKVLKNPTIKKKRHLEIRIRNQWSLAHEEYIKSKGGI